MGATPDDGRPWVWGARCGRGREGTGQKDSVTFPFGVVGLERWRRSWTSGIMAQEAHACHPPAHTVFTGEIAPRQRGKTSESAAPPAPQNLNCTLLPAPGIPLAPWTRLHTPGTSSPPT